MTKYLLMGVAFFVGMGLPIQAALNAQMKTALQNPLLATFVSFAGGLAAISLILLITTPGIPAWNATGSTPWYLYCGGLPGVVFVTMMLIMVKHIGPTNALAAAFAGQFVASLAFDHFGWLGVPIRPVNTWRLLGVGLLVCGMLLVSRTQAQAETKAAPADVSTSAVE